MRLFDSTHPPAALATPSVLSVSHNSRSLFNALLTNRPVNRLLQPMIHARPAVSASMTLATAAAATNATGALRPFTLSEPLYDQSTFYGRLRTIMMQLDPTRMFTSRETIEKSVKMLDDFAHGHRDPGVTDADLWEAYSVKVSRCHPDTGEIIFLPLCFAAYMPMQPLIVMGMLWPGGGMVNQAFWQWCVPEMLALTCRVHRLASRYQTFTPPH